MRSEIILGKSFWDGVVDGIDQLVEYHYPPVWRNLALAKLICMDSNKQQVLDNAG